MDENEANADEGNLKGSSNTNFEDRPPVVARVLVASAALKNLFTVPIVLIAAPGAGKMVQLKSCAISYRYLTAAHTISGAPGIIYDGGTIATEMIAAPNIKDLFEAAASGVIVSNDHAITAGFLARTKVENKAVVLTDSANWTGGGGAAVIELEYVIVDL